MSCVVVMWVIFVRCKGSVVGVVSFVRVSIVAVMIVIAGAV